MRIRIFCGLILASASLAGCTTGDSGTGLPGVASVVPSERPETKTASAEKHGKLDGLIAVYSAAYNVPASLIHRVVKRESNYDPKAYHAGNYGLMQIRYRTAKGMGYDGSPHGLLDAETNLKYAVKYLKGAWLVADGSEQRADRLYQTGYYYDAKRKGMLDRVGWDALAAVKPMPDAGQTAQAAVVQAAQAGAKPAGSAQPGPTLVAAASLQATQPFAEPEAARFTGSIDPAPSRFGGASAPRPAAAPTVVAAAHNTALGYAGPAPEANFALPDVMAAPPIRPRS
jgi:hypothetical protein